MKNVFRAVEEQLLMEKELGLTEARGKLSHIVNEVMYRGDTYIIKKQGEPAAALVPIALLEKLKQDRQALFDSIRAIQAQNADADPDEVMQLALEAQQAVRAQQTSIS